LGIRTFIPFLFLFSFSLFSLEFYIERSEEKEDPWVQEYPINELQWTPQTIEGDNPFPFPDIDLSSPLPDTWKEDDPSPQWSEPPSRNLYGGVFMRHRNSYGLFSGWTAITSAWNLDAAVFRSSEQNGVWLDTAWNPSFQLRYNQQFLYDQDLFWHQYFSWNSNPSTYQLDWLGYGLTENPLAQRFSFTYQRDISYAWTMESFVGWDIATAMGQWTSQGFYHFDSLALGGSIGLWRDQFIHPEASLSIKDKEKESWFLQGGYKGFSQNPYRLKHRKAYAYSEGDLLLGLWFLKSHWNPVNILWLGPGGMEFTSPDLRELDSINWHWNQEMDWLGKIHSISTQMHLYGDLLLTDFSHFSLTAQYQKNDNPLGFNAAWHYRVDPVFQIPLESTASVEELGAYWQIPTGGILTLKTLWDLSGIDSFIIQYTLGGP